MCKEEADAIVFVFSFTDPSGLTNISTNLPGYMNDKSKPAPIVIGTKYKGFVIFNEIMFIKKKYFISDIVRVILLLKLQLMILMNLKKHKKLPY